MVSILLAGAGFSFSAGLNAYLPLLILALADRMSSTIDLESPYSGISSNVGILILLLVLPLELIADKIPRLDHFNDLLHTAIRPLVGAFCFMAVADQDGSLNVWVAGLLGMGIAGAVHVWKMRSRPGVAAGSQGLGTPFVSVLEDALSIVLAIFAAFLPWATIALIPVSVWLLRRSYTRMTLGESRVVRPFLPKTPA